jgi:5'-3' exonuclease
MKSKVIIIDWGIVSHRAIFSYASVLKRAENNPNSYVVPATYTALSMIIGILKKIGVNPDVDDKVIIAVDSKHNWRKEIDKNYKSNRKEQREKTEVNWKEEFKKMDILLNQIELGTPFHIIKIDGLECDDIVAETCRYYTDREIVIASYDQDFLQLLVYDNVRIFSPHPKAKNCPYKILDLDREKEKTKAYKVLAKKIEKEVSDNLVTEILTEKDFEKREMIVSLLNLPEFVKIKVKKALDKIDEEEKEDFDVEELPFPSLQKRFKDIFKEDKVITYQKCREKAMKKNKKKGGKK